MSSPTLKEVIDIGNDLRGMKYYETAAAAVIFYDYFLTFADEIEYAWHGRKSWVFGVFLTVSADGISSLVIVLCDKTAFFSGFTFVFSTFLAQVVLTLRVYAVTYKNRIITTWLSVITTSQFILGLYFTGNGATRGAQQILLPLDAYKVCVLKRHRPMEIGFTTLSLLYDLTAFSVIVYSVLKSNGYQRRMPLLENIAQDTTYYFLIIFTSHLALELTLSFARPTLQLIPAAGNVVYLPVMIARLMLSLKKASASQEDNAWSLGQPTTQTVIFAERGVAPDTTDFGMCLDTFASTSGGVARANSRV